MKKICPKCGEKKTLTAHHIVPLRVFKKSKATIGLCKTCHRELEVEIFLAEKRLLLIYSYETPEEAIDILGKHTGIYINVLDKFLGKE